MVDEDAGGPADPERSRDADVDDGVGPPHRSGRGCRRARARIALWLLRRAPVPVVVLLPAPVLLAVDVAVAAGVHVAAAGPDDARIVSRPRPVAGDGRAALARAGPARGGAGPVVRHPGRGRPLVAALHLRAAPASVDVRALAGLAVGSRCAGCRPGPRPASRRGRRRRRPASRYRSRGCSAPRRRRRRTGHRPPRRGCRRRSRGCTRRRSRRSGSGRSRVPP